MEKAKFTIRGGKSLSGTIQVPGAKNAALKLIAATLLTKESVTLENVPNITDVVKMLDILEQLGADVERDWDNHKVTITAESIDPSNLVEDDVRAIRASIVLLGPLVTRCSKVSIPYPGGDKIGARPLTAHFSALRQLGVELVRSGNSITATVPKSGLKPADIVLPAQSVTGTEIALMAAAGTEGVSTVHVSNAEPHIQDLALLLTQMGAKTVMDSPNVYTVHGKKNLNGTSHRIISDLLDAFTFLIAGIVTRGDVTTVGVEPNQAQLALAKLKEMGACIETEEDRIRVLPKSGTYKASKIQTNVFPGIATDLQPMFALMATQAEGVSLVHDPIFENRFRYMEELRRMGADVQTLDPHRAHVNGPTQLVGVPITSFDIRAGAVLILAGLVAQGITEIDGIEHVDRGYEDIEGRLNSLGASIVRE